MTKTAAKRARSSRFSPTLLGFLRFRARSGSRLAKNSWKKWRPILRQLEELRIQRFDLPWNEIHPEDIAYELIPALYSRCKSKKGGAPSTNTYRGRYDACKSYFDFLVVIGELDANPCNWQHRPSSKANLQPFLEPSDDEKLARAPKEGHEVSVYALARGAALREEEICQLEDRDLDFENDQIIVRDGKTPNAPRLVPMLPTTKILLLRYRAWRDEHVLVSSPCFVRTRSGTISPAYVWKLTKTMAARAEVRLVRDEAGEIQRDPSGLPLSEVTPHALRRTFATDFANRGVPTISISPVIGHSSPRVTENSYALSSKEHAARQLFLAAGEGPFSLAASLSDLNQMMSRADDVAAADPQAALAELRRLQKLASDLERSLLRVAPELNRPTNSAAPTTVEASGHAAADAHRLR